MSRSMLFLAALGAAGLTAGCGEVAAATALPPRILPAAINGMTITEDTAARSGFNVDHSLMSQGRLYVMRYGGYVYGALEVVSLKPSIDSTDIDQQQRIRSQIGTGVFQYYEVAGQWFGEQDSHDDRIFVWFPGFGAAHIVEVLTLTTDFPQPRAFLAAVVRYQEIGS
ncbi:MAG: hypothetical protein ACYDAC_06345 [Candidatus Dormibacteria bacterium]